MALLFRKETEFKRFLKTASITSWLAGRQAGRKEGGNERKRKGRLTDRQTGSITAIERQAKNENLKLDFEEHEVSGRRENSHNSLDFGTRENGRPKRENKIKI